MSATPVNLNVADAVFRYWSMFSMFNFVCAFAPVRISTKQNIAVVVSNLNMIWDCFFSIRLITVKNYKVLKPVRIANNGQAFVLLGTSPIRRRRRRLPNVFIKDKNLFCCSIVNLKLGQKLNREPKDETRYSSAPIAQMQCWWQLFVNNYYVKQS